MEPLFESRWAATSWGVAWVFMFISAHQMSLWNIGFSCGAMLLMGGFHELSRHLESEHQIHKITNKEVNE